MMTTTMMTMTMTMLNMADDADSDDILKITREKGVSYETFKSN